MCTKERNKMDKKEIIYEQPGQEMRVVKEPVTANYFAKRKYTYDEVRLWITPEHRRYELIDGVPLLMASPTPAHQLISAELSFLFCNYLQGKECRLIHPVDTVLSYGKGKDTYFIPDLIVLCSRNKIKRNGIFGAPNLVIEILTPSTSSRDRVEKRYKYEEAGVKEYWIVDPRNKSIEVSLLQENGKFISRTYKLGDMIKVSIFKDFEINVVDVFANPWLETVLATNDEQKT